jgi:hypothetical protein
VPSDFAQHVISVSYIIIILDIIDVSFFKKCRNLRRGGLISQWDLF